jgi:hypothetical protein
LYLRHLCLQNRLSKRVTGKIVFLKELRFNEKSPMIFGAFFFSLYSIAAGGNYYATRFTLIGAGFASLGLDRFWVCPHQLSDMPVSGMADYSTQADL